MLKSKHYAPKLITAVIVFAFSMITHLPIIDLAGFVYLAWICTSRREWNLRGVAALGFGMIVSGWSRISLERSMLSLIEIEQPQVRSQTSQTDPNMLLMQSDFRQGAVLILLGVLLMIYADTRQTPKISEPIVVETRENPDDRTWPPAPKIS